MDVGESQTFTLKFPSTCSLPVRGYSAVARRHPRSAVWLSIPQGQDGKGVYDALIVNTDHVLQHTCVSRRLQRRNTRSGINNRRQSRCTRCCTVWLFWSRRCRETIHISLSSAIILKSPIPSRNLLECRFNILLFYFSLFYFISN